MAYQCSASPDHNQSKSLKFIAYLEINFTIILNTNSIKTLDEPIHRRAAHRRKLILTDLS